MIGAGTAYIAGSFFAFLFSPVSGAVCAAGIFAAALFILRDRKEFFRDTIMVIILWSMGFLFYSGYTVLRARPAQDLAGTVGSFSGKVEDFTLYDGEKASYTLSGKANGKVYARVIFYTDDLGARIGDVISVDECGFEAISGDYLYDSRDHYKSRKIFLQLSDGKASLTEMNARPIKNLLWDFREKMVGRFRSELGEDAGAFLAGMVFGEKQGIDPNLKAALYRTGIGHILAVSGLHVSIIAALIMTLMNWLKVNRFVSFGVMNLLLLLLIVLARSPVSAIRAAIMLDLVYSARLFLRIADPLNSMSIAVLLICLVNPYSIHNAGLWLSLSGTFGIAVLSPYLTKEIPADKLSGRIFRAFAAAFITTVSVFPLSLLYFDEVSVISPVTNVLLVPLCTLAMVLGVVFVVTGGFLPVLAPAGVLINMVIKVSDAVSSAGFSHIADSGAFLPVLTMILGAVVIAVYFATFKRRKVLIALAAAIGVFSLSAAGQMLVRRNTFRVAVLGRGSNAAVVVSYKGSRDVFDLSGNYRSPQYVRKYLMCDGADKADNVVLTKNIQAQYAAYYDALSIFPSKTWLSAGDTPVFGGGDVQLFGEGGFDFQTDSYSAHYSDGSLTITHGGTTVTFVPAKDAGDTGALTVCYGEIPKNTEIRTDGTIYLDGKPGSDHEYSDLNNFEIIIPESGNEHIRRL